MARTPVKMPVRKPIKLPTTKSAMPMFKGERPATRVPRNGRVSPIRDTMARSGPDAPARKVVAAPTPTGVGSANAIRTSKGRKGAMSF